jgi:hypothetical protein
MRFDYLHIALGVAEVWLLLNLAAIGIYTTLFSVERALFLIRQRRFRKPGRLAPVICITSR